jgi:hypothetical protein
MCCSFYDNAPGGVASPHWRIGEGMNSNSLPFSNFRSIAVFKPRLSKLADCCRLLTELGMSDLKDVGLDAFAWHLGAADRCPATTRKTQQSRTSIKMSWWLFPNRIDMEKLQ